MKPRFLLPLSLVTVFAAACAPAARPTVVQEAAMEPPAVVLATATLAPASESPTETAVTAEPARTPLPAATSRGPDLQATDPNTVSLASGGLQFVEFFRFT